IKWLDRVKQQPNPIPGATADRCIPSAEPAGDSSETATASEPASNYVMSLVIDRYEGVSPSFGSTRDTYNNYGTSSSRVDRSGVVVYNNGRFRMEKSRQETNSSLRAQVFLDSLSQAELQQLQQLLAVPDLASLKSRTPPAGVAIREGELVNLMVPRGGTTQK